MIIFVALASASSMFEGLLGFHEGDECKYTRVDALLCLIEHVDRSRDGQIDSSEFEYCKQHFLPAMTSVIMWIAHKAHYNIPFSQVLRDCDANHDGILTPWDWMHSNTTCLPTQSQLCKLKTICDIASSEEK